MFYVVYATRLQQFSLKSTTALEFFQFKIQMLRYVLATQPQGPPTSGFFAIEMERLQAGQPSQGLEHKMPRLL